MWLWEVICLFQIAIVALLGLCVDLEHKYRPDKDGDLLEYVDKKCDHLKASRPTAINLSNEILRLKAFVRGLKKNNDVVDKKRWAAFICNLLNTLLF